MLRKLTQLSRPFLLFNKPTFCDKKPPYKIQITKEDVETMKRFMKGDYLDDMPEAKEFFKSQEQALSFRLLQMQKKEEIHPLFEQFNAASIGKKHLIMSRYLNLGGRLTDSIGDKFASQLYRQIDTLEEAHLEEFLGYICAERQSYERNIVPKQVPYIPEPSHQSTNLLVLLLTLYPEHFQKIINHYSLQPAIYNCRQLCYILSFSPNEPNLLACLASSLKQAQPTEIVECLIFCLHKGAFPQEVTLFLNPNFLSKCKIGDNIQLLYNFVSKKQLTLVQESCLPQTIRQQLQNHESLLQPQEYVTIWNTAVMLWTESKQEYESYSMVDILEHSINDGLEIDLEQLQPTEIFNVLVAYRMLLPPLTINTPKLAAEIKSKQVLKTFLRRARTVLKGEQALVAGIIASAFEQEHSFINTETLSQLSKFQSHPQYSSYVKRMLTKCGYQ